MKYFTYLADLSHRGVVMQERQILFKPQRSQNSRAACWFSLSFPLSGASTTSPKQILLFYWF